MKTLRVLEKGDVFLDKETNKRYMVLTSDYADGKNDYEPFACLNIDSGFVIVFKRGYIEGLEYIENHNYYCEIAIDCFAQDISERIEKDKEREKWVKESTKGE